MSMTAARYPNDNIASVDTLFARQVTAAPDAGALVWAGGRISYSDLDARANRLCRLLQRAGLRRGGRVAMLLPRSPDAIVTMLATLKAGAAFVPLDPSHGARQIGFIVTDSAPAMVVARRATLAGIGQDPPWSAPTLVLEDMAAAIAAESADAPETVTGREDAAYVMYTSGSTGQPKGVVVPHRAIVRLTRGCDFVDLGPDETILQLAPLAFDASTLEIWGSLLNGGKLAFVSDEQPTLDDIAAAIADHGVTTLWLTAGLFHLMVDHRLDGLRPLRQLLAGGDVLSPPHVRRALAALPGCRLINGYGPTENTTFTCCYTIPHEGWGDGPVPIGRAIAGTTVHVLDDALHPVADGEPGQLCAGGEGVALGYLNRPDLTAAKFVASPFRPGDRLYLTGDMVRRRPDGVLDFIGRVDRQVKINGKRIELDAIETALRDCPLVRDGAVVLREDVPGHKRIAAYATPAGAPVGLTAAIQAFLRDRLPPYMVPNDVVVLDSLKLTANGKVDRASLPAPQVTTEAAPDAGTVASPRGPLEQRLTAICRDVLGAATIGSTENFFDLGATSLQIVAMHAAIVRTLNIKLALVDLFAHPNVADLARHLDGGLHADADLRSAQDRSRRGRDAMARLRRGRMEQHA